MAVVPSAVDLAAYPLDERLMLVEAELDRVRLGQDSANLRALLGTLHRADIADLIERLPQDDREQVWELTDASLRIGVLADLSDPAASSLVASTADDVLVEALRADESVDDLAVLLRQASPARRSRLIREAGLAHNADLSRSLSYSEDAVGSLMDFEQVVVAADETVGQVCGMLQEMGDLPMHADKLFVVDSSDKLCGILPLKRLLIAKPQETVRSRMVADKLHTLAPETDIADAASMFERYDLVSAPVLDSDGRICGRLTIDEIVAQLSDDQHSGLLNAAGVDEDYDLYAPLPRRLMHRGLWMMLNLVAAFAVSRVVGSFEVAIAQIVALAALMPVVSSLAGSSSMQTATVIIRALALEQVSAGNAAQLLLRELALGAANGLVLGFLVGCFGYAVYGNLQLALVLAFSQFVVFVLAAVIGYCVPLMVKAMRGDPALGTSVLVTFACDCLSFFIFLGLATVLLL